MKKLLLVFGFFLYSQALDCGIHMNKNEALKETISKCIISNKTLEGIWDMTSMSSESESTGSSEEHPAVDQKMFQNFRSRRANSKEEKSVIGYQQQENPSNDTDSDDSNSKQNDNPVENSKESGTCVIQCIFENLQMMDSSGFPDHAKVLDGLMKNASGRELRDFLQDSTDDCFHEMEKESNADACSYSLKLLSCLAQKGKSNCADWPIGDLIFKR